MNKKLNQFIFYLKEDFKLYLSISFGIFLFILFFEPFSLNYFDFNNRLIFVLGLGTIAFITILIVKTPLFWLKNQPNGNQNTLPSLLGGFFMIAFSSVAFAFYLRYVGQVPITFSVMFKVIIINMVPPVILKVNDTIMELRRQNDLLAQQHHDTLNQLHSFQDQPVDQSIQIRSENQNENLHFQLDDVLLIQSANNYVEVILRENDEIAKKLMRNTLKNVETQLKTCNSLVRCHRTTIVNINEVEKLSRHLNNYWLKINGYEAQIPVSRQYLLKLKESLYTH